MKTCFTLLAALATAGCMNVVSAQDILYKWNNEKQEVKVTELGLDEVKFKLPGDTSGVIRVMDMEEISRIRFADGKEWKNTLDPYSVSISDEVRAKKRAIKFYYLSPIFGYLNFGYEQVIKPGISLQADLGIIGPNLNKAMSAENYKGAFVRVGPRLRIGSEYRMRGMQTNHLLAGKYIMPQLCVSHFSNDFTYEEYNNVSPYYFTTTYKTGRESTTAVAMNIVYGKQGVTLGGLVFDTFFGIGFGWVSSSAPAEASNYNTDVHYNCFSHIYGGDEFPVTISGGLSIGFLAK